MTHIRTETRHTNPNLPTSVVFLMIHDKLVIAFGDESFMFLTCQLSDGVAVAVAVVSFDRLIW